jgi:hypothetical protein
MQTRHDRRSHRPPGLTAYDRLLYCKDYGLLQFLRDGAPGLPGILLLSSTAGLVGAGWLAASMLS